MEEYIVYKYDKSKSDIPKIEFGDIECGFAKNIACDAEYIKKKVYHSVTCGGGYSICYLKAPDGKVIHYSFVIPYCRKFSFMNKHDVCIGPCWTKEEYRGKGLYGNVLNFIAKTVLAKTPDADLYALVREANVSSTKGIHKANYIPAGKCTKTKYLKHYKKADWF